NGPAASDRNPDSAANDRNPDSAASDRNPDSAASDRNPDSAASDKKPDSAASDKKPDDAGSNNPFRPRRGSAMERKVTNDAVAYIRGLAELRGRNADWAEDAVRNAASLSATDALAKHVTDVIARDLPDLLRQIDGREVQIGNASVKLATRGL